MTLLLLLFKYDEEEFNCPVGSTGGGCPQSVGKLPGIGVQHNYHKAICSGPLTQDVGLPSSVNVVADDL